MNVFGSVAPNSRALARVVFPWSIAGSACLSSLIILSCAGAGTTLVSPDFITSDTTISVRSIGNPFQGASRMSVSPDGMIHVADASAGLIIRLRLDGSGGRSLGGSGSAPGELFEPRDVAASSGIFVWVADAGNGRIQRFSAQGALIEILPVPSASEAVNDTPRPIFRPENIATTGSSGRPTAIAVSENDDLYILEEVSGAVLWTDRHRSEWHVLGGLMAGPGRLQRPVDLAYHEGNLYVADAGSASIRRYDTFGSHTGNVGTGLLEGVSRIHVSRSGILAVLPNSLLSLDLDGNTIRPFSVLFSSDTTVGGQRGDQDVTGAQWVGERLIILTRTRLFVSHP